MIKDRAKDVLINMGMPASIKGLDYITDIIELFDSGHQNDKITSVYADIGKKDNSSGSRVERAIRHAFGIVITKGNCNLVEKYLSFDNTTNSALLKLLYYRLKQEEKEESNLELRNVKMIVQESGEYQKALQLLENDLVLAVRKFIKSIREVSTDACSKVG
jgi:hypothetical protein